MSATIEHPQKKWEISIIEIHNSETLYKVTRRVPEQAVSETKMFKTLAQAKKQFDEWLC